jgi:hypothetical protein
MQKEEMMKIVMAFKAELETYSEQLDLHNKMEEVLRGHA